MKEKTSFGIATDLKREVKKYTDSPSHPSLAQEEYHKITETFSDPLITYPPAVTVSEQEIHDKINDKNLKNRISTPENNYRTSVQSSAEIYYCPSDRKSSTRSYAEKYKQDTKAVATPVYESSSAEVDKSLAVKSTTKLETSHAETPSNATKLMLEGQPLFSISSIQLKDYFHSDVHESLTKDSTTPLSDRKYLQRTEGELKYDNNQHQVTDKNAPLKEHIVNNRNKNVDIIQASDSSTYVEHDYANTNNLTMVSQSARTISMIQSINNNSIDLNNEISKQAFPSQGLPSKLTMKSQFYDLPLEKTTEEVNQTETISSKYQLNSEPNSVPSTEIAVSSKVSSNIIPNETNDTNILQTKKAVEIVTTNDKSEQNLLIQKSLEKNEQSLNKVGSSFKTVNDVGEVASKTAALYQIVKGDDSGMAGQKEICTKTITPQRDSWKISATVRSGHDNDTSDHVLEQNELITKHNETREASMKSSSKSTSKCSNYDGIIINQETLSRSTTKIEPIYCDDDGENTNVASKTIFKCGDNPNTIIPYLNEEKTSKIVTKIPAKYQLAYYESDLDSNESKTNNYLTRENSIDSSKIKSVLDAEIKTKVLTSSEASTRYQILSYGKDSTVVGNEQTEKTLKTREAPSTTVTENGITERDNKGTVEKTQPPKQDSLEKSETFNDFDSCAVKSNLASKNEHNFALDSDMKPKTLSCSELFSKSSTNNLSSYSYNNNSTTTENEETDNVSKNIEVITETSLDNNNISYKISAEYDHKYMNDGEITNQKEIIVKTLRPKKVLSKVSKESLYVLQDSYEKDSVSNIHKQKLYTNSTSEVSTVSLSKSVPLCTSESICRKSSSTKITQNLLLHTKSDNEVRVLSENKEFVQDISIEASEKIESNYDNHGVIPKRNDFFSKDVSKSTLKSKSSRIDVSELYTDSLNAPRESLKNKTILPRNKYSTMYDKNILSTGNTPNMLSLDKISDPNFRLLKTTKQSNNVTANSLELTPKSTISSSKSAISKSVHNDHVNSDEGILKTSAFDVSLECDPFEVESKITANREESHIKNDNVSIKNVIPETVSAEKVSLENLRKLSINLLPKNSNARIFDQGEDYLFSITETTAETLSPKKASLLTSNVSYNELIPKTALSKEGSLREVFSKTVINRSSNVCGSTSMPIDPTKHTEVMTQGPLSNDKVSVFIPNETTAEALSGSFGKTDNKNTDGSIPIDLILQSSSKDVSSIILKDDHSISFEISARGSSLKKLPKSPNNTSEKAMLRRKTSSKISARELLQNKLSSLILSKSSTKSKMDVKNRISKTSCSDASKSIAIERDAKTLTSMELFSFDLSVERTLEGTKEIMRTSRSTSSLNVLEITSGNESKDIQRCVDLEIDIESSQQYETNTEITAGKLQFDGENGASVPRRTVEQTEFVENITNSKSSIMKFENTHSFSESLILTEKQSNIARSGSKEMQNHIAIAHLNDFDKINSTDNIDNKALSNLEPNLNISIENFTKSSVGIEKLEPLRDGLEKKVCESNNMQTEADNINSKVQQRLSEIMCNVTSKLVDRSQSEIKSEIGTFITRSSDTSLEPRLTELAYTSSQNRLLPIELTHNDSKSLTDQYIIGYDDALIVDNYSMDARSNIPKTEPMHKSESIIDLSNTDLVPTVALENNARRNISVVSEVSKPVEKLSVISVHGEATSPEKLKGNNQQSESQIQQADTEYLRNKIRQVTSKHLSEESALKITEEGVLSSMDNDNNDSARQSVIEPKNTPFISSEYKGLSSNAGDITMIGLENKKEISQSYTSLSTNQIQDLETKYEDNSQSYHGTKNIESKTNQSLNDAKANEESTINEEVRIKGVLKENSTKQEHLNDTMDEKDHKSKESIKIKQQNYSTTMTPTSFENKVTLLPIDSPSSNNKKLEDREKNKSETDFKTAPTERLFEISKDEERRYVTKKPPELVELNRSEIDVQSLNGFAQSPDTGHQTENHLMDESEVILLDVAFQSYLNGRNEKVLKSFDSNNMPATRYKNDTISTFRSTMRSSDDPMSIDIDSSTVLLMGVDKRNLQLTASKEMYMNLQNKVVSQGK